MTYYARDAADLPSFDVFNASIAQSGAGAGADPGDDDPHFVQYTDISLSPPGGSDTASQRCLGATVSIVSTAAAASYMIKSDSAPVRMFGNFYDVEAANGDVGLIRPAFASVSISTKSAPVVLTDILAESIAALPDPLTWPLNFVVPPSLVVTSQTGSVVLFQVTATGISVKTSGNIQSQTVFSTKIHQCAVAICGDVSLTTTGAGSIAHTAVLGGSALNFQTDRGTLTIANSAVVYGTTARLTSGSGNIYLSSFLSASGNETYVTSTNGGSITSGVSIINRAFFATTGGGKISIVVDYMGAATPPADESSPVRPLAPYKYALPLLSLVSDRGDISVLGCGGSPSNATFANYASLSADSNLGNVKIEVNGDGLNAPYRVTADRGSSVVEIDGRPAPNSGVLGDIVGSGLNSVRLHSAGGDVQLSLLAKPY